MTRMSLKVYTRLKTGRCADAVHSARGRRPKGEYRGAHFPLTIAFQLPNKGEVMSGTSVVVALAALR